MRESKVPKTIPHYRAIDQNHKPEVGYGEILEDENHHER